MGCYDYRRWVCGFEGVMARSISPYNTIADLAGSENFFEQWLLK